MATATDTRTTAHGTDHAARRSALDLTPAEAELLRAALREDWVELLLGLWPSWGFCARHALGFASLELEVNDRLFSTAIYYHHFVEGAAEIASARFRSWRGIRYYLMPRAECVICERLVSGKAVGLNELADTVNQCGRVHERLEEARAQWQRRACPLCVPAGEGIVCRPHLLAGAKQEALGLQLDLLSQRIQRLIGSMCAQKTATDVLDRFAWLETIAWFTGWAETKQLLLEQGARDAC